MDEYKTKLLLDEVGFLVEAPDPLNNYTCRVLKPKEDNPNYFRVVGHTSVYAWELQEALLRLFASNS